MNPGSHRFMLSASSFIWSLRMSYAQLRHLCGHCLAWELCSASLRNCPVRIQWSVVVTNELYKVIRKMTKIAFLTHYKTNCFTESSSSRLSHKYWRQCSTRVTIIQKTTTDISALCMPVLVKKITWILLWRIIIMISTCRWSLPEHISGDFAKTMDR